MKVIVTGGAGFIGSHLVSGLESRGHEVINIDIKLDPKLDVRKPNQIADLFKDCQCVFHLAALPSVPYTIEHPLETHETNLTGTLNVLNLASEAGVKKFVFSSSAAVYGYPQSPYAVQKAASEIYLKYFALSGLETVSLRYFNVYGPGQKADDAYASVIPKFLELKRAGRALTIIGDGRQTRDFIHVSDVVLANLAAMESTKIGNGETMDIASGQSVSINQVAEIFGGPVEHLPPRQEVRDSKADITLAKKLLGWEPKVVPEEGIGIMAGS